MYWVSLQAVSNGSENLEVTTPASSKVTHVENENETGNKMRDSDNHAAEVENPNAESILNAYTVAPSQQVVTPKIPNTSDQLIEVTLALALVVGVIYGVAWIIKRNKNLSPSAAIPMKTLSVLPMGVKEKIVLVEVGGKQLLLGMTPHQINTLATFDEPIIDTTLNNEKPFSSRLKEMLNQGKMMEPKE